MNRRYLDVCYFPLSASVYRLTKNVCAKEYLCCKMRVLILILWFKITKYVRMNNSLYNLICLLKLYRLFLRIFTFLRAWKEVSGEIIYQILWNFTRFKNCFIAHCLILFLSFRPLYVTESFFLHAQNISKKE